MKSNSIKLIFLIAAISLCGVFLLFNRAKSNTLGITTVNTAEDKIKSIIPKSSFLREYKPLSEFGDSTFLVLYVENPKIDPETKNLGMGYFLTCLGEQIGRGIEGIYHLAIIDDGKIVSEKTIPGSNLPSPDATENSPQLPQNTIKLAYQNIKWNTHWDTGEATPSSEHEIDPVNVELMNFQDVNGDGLKNEFVLPGQVVGCALHERLVAGYTPSKEVKLYPFISNGKTQNWLDHFSVEKPGQIVEEWQCGDHGQADHEVTSYQFKDESFQLVSHSIKPCI
ncbi:MAG: hypothetical protein M1607_03345 [Patescibacteria group bacterium]|nr:hypothetical protein [Patescibacteria group bacterium]